MDASYCCTQTQVHKSPLSHWRTYKPKEIFTQHDAWDLFFNMMEAGYVPFPGTALPQLKSAIKKQ
jgi:hypothetical protein